MRVVLTVTSLLSLTVVSVSASKADEAYKELVPEEIKRAVNKLMVSIKADDYLTYFTKLVAVTCAKGWDKYKDTLPSLFMGTRPIKPKPDGTMRIQWMTGCTVHTLLLEMNNLHFMDLGDNELKIFNRYKTCATNLSNKITDENRFKLLGKSLLEGKCQQ